MDVYDPDCWSCQDLMGKRRVATAPRIHEARYWNIEHVPETSIEGWIVIVLRRHASALHELSDEEFQELALLTRQCSRILHHLFSSAQEYLMQFAESEHFRHVHVHLVPRLNEWPDDLRGPRVLSAIGEEAANKLSAEQMTSAANSIRQALAKETNYPAVAE